MNKYNNTLFIGSKKLGLNCLLEIYSLDPGSITGILTFDDRKDPRSVYDEFGEFAAQYDIDLHVAKNKKDSEQIISWKRPDICFVVGWYWIISRKTLDNVPGGFLGIHNSLLPEYRGGSPLVWAMINGERTVGTTLFSFTEGMDEGDIWAQEKIEIGPDDYISDVLDKLEEKAILILRNNYVRILRREMEPRPQDHGRATFCAMRKPSDGLIDWRKTANEIYNFIRAQSAPYPGAFTYIDNDKITIWKARPEDAIGEGAPGQVLEKSGDCVRIICGDKRLIRIEEIGYGGEQSPPGKFINSSNIHFKSS